MDLYNKGHIFLKPYEGKSSLPVRFTESSRLLKGNKPAAGEHGSGEVRPNGFRKGATGPPVIAEGIVGCL